MAYSLAKYVVVGLGQTGLSCAHYLIRQNEHFFIVDSRNSPPGLAEITTAYPHISVITGTIEASVLTRAEFMIISPGIALNTPAIQEAMNQGVKLISDVDLFFQHVCSPVIGITGTNGKSTVTALVGEMAKQAGINSVIAGNIGVPVLDLLNSPPYDLYIIELSSFQLERAGHLSLKVAALLNIAPDHLDVHSSFERYVKAKHHIFAECHYAVYCQEEKITKPAHLPASQSVTFTSRAPQHKQFGVIKNEWGDGIAQGEQVLLYMDEMKLRGRHNLINAVAALTIGNLLLFPLNIMLDVLRSFPGLAHRCQWVACIKGVNWFNDSKGTNEASSCAAIEGLAFSGRKGLILIAGGDGKGANFQQLAKSVQCHVRIVILFGQDAVKIAAAIGSKSLVYNVNDLAAAVALAHVVAQTGERVLLSPACTSWDMFSDYQERGEKFIEQVNNLE